MKFNKRGIVIHPEELTENWLERMNSVGLNELGLHPVGGPYANESLENAIKMRHTIQFKHLEEKTKSYGINYNYQAHAMSWILPRELFNRYPTWYRMDESGNRVADFNMCPSNDEALSYITEKSSILAKLLDTGDDKYFIWLDDVEKKTCHCEKCQNLSASDQQMKILLAILAGLKAYNSSAKLCYLAYQGTMEQPSIVKPHKDIFLEFAPFNRDLHCPINDPNSDKNKKEIQNLKSMLDYFGQIDATILEYWMDNSMASGWKKPPKKFLLDVNVMKADTRFYASLGFHSVTSFGCYLGPDYQELYGNVDLQQYAEQL